MSNTPLLTVAVSSRSLFHMEDGNAIFEKEGAEAFNQYMREKEDVPLRPGTAFPLIKKLLGLNSPGVRDRVDVVLLSRNSPAAGMRVRNTISHYGLDIERAVFTQGANRFAFAKAFNADLFLSASPSDVRAALDNGIAAATMLPRELLTDEVLDNAVRIALDGDAVLFSDEADAYYREHGLEAFRTSEVANAHIPLGAGPFKNFVMKLHALQQQFPLESSPIRVALVTARGMPADARVWNTLRHWGLEVDEAFFCGGLPKGPILEAFGADIFFDDTKKNIDSAVASGVTSGHVPFGTGHGIVAH